MNSVVPSPGRVLAHLVAFAACAWVAFLRNSEWIFHGLDGRYIWALVEQQHDWTPLRAGLGMNPLQGIGNVTLAYNFNLAPAYWRGRLTSRLPGRSPRTRCFLWSFSLRCFWPAQSRVCPGPRACSERGSLPHWRFQ